MIYSAPIPLLSTHDVISGPVTSFPVPASIPCPTALSVPVPKTRPHGQTGHVGQIRLSDWLKFEILPSDWLRAKPTPCTTSLTLPKLTSQLADTCDSFLTKEECHASLKEFSRGKSLGTDSLTAEFYLKFWELLGQELVGSLNYVFEIGELSIS